MKTCYRTECVWLEGSTCKRENYVCLSRMTEPEQSASATVESPSTGSPVSSDELWDLRQRVLLLGMPDPWDAESGCARPIPEGFEEEVARFDNLQSKQIRRINETLDLISNMAIRTREIEKANATGEAEETKREIK